MNQEITSNSSSIPSGVKPLARDNDRVGPPRYVILPTNRGWQLLIEHAHHYLRWTLQTDIGQPGEALPAADVAAASIEGQNGSLKGVPALEHAALEIGEVENLREDNGGTVAIGRCLQEGNFRLKFTGTYMRGSWRLTRTGAKSKSPEVWMLRCEDKSLSHKVDAPSPTKAAQPSNGSC